MLASGANVLTVHPSVPVNSVKELIALAKQKPGELNYASAGSGSFQHLGSELFKLMAGVDIVHVPFKGGGPAMIDVVGGHSQVLVSSLVQTGAHIRSGKLKALGIGSPTRSTLFPDIPTIAEAGVPGYEMANWWGILAPAGTPQPDRRQARQGDRRRPLRAGDAEALRRRGRRGRAEDARPSSQRSSRPSSPNGNGSSRRPRSRRSSGVIPGLGPGIQPSASSGASVTVDPGDKHRDDKR